VGSLLIIVQDAEGLPVPGVCFDVLNASAGFGVLVCDVAGGGGSPVVTFDYSDRQPSPGFIEIADLPVGTYVVQPRLDLGQFLAQSGVDVVILDGQLTPVTVRLERAEGPGPVVDATPLAVTDTPTPTPTETPSPTATPTPTPTVTPIPEASLSVEITDEKGDHVGGVCIQLQTPGVPPIDRCDNDDNDSEPSDGLMEIYSLPPGRYSIVVPEQPAGFANPAPQFVTLEANGPMETVIIVLRTEAPPTRTPRPTSTPRPTGTPVPTSAEPTTTEVTATPEATETSTPPGPPTDTPEPSVTPEPTTGSVEVYLRNRQRQEVGGGCVELRGEQRIQACDGDGTDANAKPGIIRFNDVPFGTYAVVVTTPPPGYKPPRAPKPATISATDPIVRPSFVLEVSPEAPPPTETPGTPTEETTAGETPTAGAAPEVTPTPEVAPEVTPTPETPVEGETPAPTTGSLVITKVDASDETVTLPKACFKVTAADGQNQEKCDEDGDGLTRFEGLAPGDASIHETQSPDDYDPGADQTVAIPENDVARISVPNAKIPPQTGSLSALAVDPEGNPLPGACYTATDPDDARDETCDTDGVGRVDFGAVPPGDWVVTQTRPPAGYDPADPAEQRVTVAPGEQPTEVTFRNAPTPAAPSRFPAALARPDAVLVVGEAQSELGCPEDDDPTCDAGALQSHEDDETWSASFALPPGSYAVHLAVRTGETEVALGNDGRTHQPGATDIVLGVPVGAAGVYVAWDRLTGAVTVVPYVNRAELQIDGGLTVPLPPAPAGGWDGFLTVGPGQHEAALLVDGNPAGTYPLDGGDSGRVHIVVGTDGSLGATTVTPASLTVKLADGEGNPLPGACFAVVGDGDRLLGQECDATDGDDGATAIRFPNGIEPGAYTVVQTGPVEDVPDQALNWAEGDTEKELPVTAG
jgi:uncharacterized surface anchored protein